MAGLALPVLTVCPYGASRRIGAFDVSLHRRQAADLTETSRRGRAPASGPRILALPHPPGNPERDWPGGYPPASRIALAQGPERLSIYRLTSSERIYLRRPIMTYRMAPRRMDSQSVERPTDSIRCTSAGVWRQTAGSGLAVLGS